MIRVMIVRIGLDWSEDQSCFRLTLKHLIFVWIKCEALTFHVDCSVRRNLLAVPSTSSFMWVRTAETGSRYFTCSRGSDLSQPTSTSRKICVTGFATATASRISRYLPLRSYARSFLEQQKFGLASSDVARGYTSKRIEPPRSNSVLILPLNFEVVL